MKRNSKLLAFLIAIAMVLSTMVIPISVGAEASEINMFGTMPFAADGSYEPGIPGDAQVAINDATAAGWRSGDANATITNDTANGYVSVTNNRTEGTDIRYNYSNSEPNKKYIVSAYIKLASSENAANAQVKVGIANKNLNILDEPTAAVNDPTALNATTWTYVYGEFTYGPALTTKGTDSKGNEIDRIFRGAHYEFYVDAAVDYDIRDIKMIDVTDGINLLHAENPGFERGIIGTVNNTSGLAHNHKTAAAISTNAAHTGMYGIEINPTSNAPEDFRYINIPNLSNNTWYKGSVMVKAADSQSVGKTASLNARTNGTNEAVIVEHPITLTQTWQKIQVEFKFPTSGKLIHMGPKIEAAHVYIDDFCLEEFELPEFSVTMMPVTVGVSSADIEVSFTTAPKSFTAENVEAESATVAVSGSGTNYTISLSGLADGETYSVSLKNVTDKYGQAAIASTSFTTTEKIAPVSDNIIVATEISQNGSGYTGIGYSPTGEWTIDKGEAENKESQVQCINQSVELGKKYLVSVKIRNNDPTPDQAATATVMASESGNSKHAIDAVMVASDTSIASSDWVEVVGIVTINAGEECNCVGDKCEKANKLMHFGVKTSANQNFSIKDLTLTELTTLSYDSDYYASIKDNGDGKATLYITNSAEDSKVYFMAAAYNGRRLADVKFESADVDEGASALTIDVPEDYTVFIWTSQCNPLCEKFYGSDF